jgi:uncharacterized membrane protein YphA (DoxX/SURF4 family)
MALVDEPRRPWPEAGASIAAPVAAGAGGARAHGMDPLAPSGTAATTAPAAAAGAATAAQPLAADWSFAQRFTLRFAACYALLYYSISLLIYIPGAGVVVGPYVNLWMRLIPWVGRAVLHLAAPVATYPNGNGSGDTMYDWVQQLCYLVFAVVGAGVWSIVARRRREERRLHEWLRLFARYSLAFILLGYGFAKVIKMQFPDPSPLRLVEPVGEMSPMGLLWTFMGFSTPYTFFAGAAEVVGAALLLFRRTAALGALVLISVTTNVVMLNFCYDVPVKLFSTNLLLVAVFLALPDLRRLADVLVFNRPTRPAVEVPLVTARWARIAGLVLKVVVVGFVLYTHIDGTLEAQRTYAGMATQGPLAGAYDVEDFALAGKSLPPLAGDASRWKRMAAQRQMVAVYHMDDTLQRYGATVDPQRRTLALADLASKVPVGTLVWSRPDPNHLVLQGILLKQPVLIKLRRLDTGKAPLLRRGFHWVNELPYNR